MTPPGPRAGSSPPKVKGAFPALGGGQLHRRPTVPLDRPAGIRCRDRDTLVERLPRMRLRNVRAKFYFVQDNEPQFYAAGAASGLAEETYRFGFPGIVNTPGLAEVYASYGNPAASFVPAVDLERYHPPSEPREPSDPVRVFFYARARSSRNSFGLGIASLARLKRDYGDRVDIVCAGEDWNPGQFGAKRKGP